MKNKITKTICLMVSFLTLGCAQTQTPSNNSESSAANPSSGSSQQSKPSSSSSSSKPSSSSVVHQHTWASEWSSDDSKHWHACSGCNQKDSEANHTFGEWTTASLGELIKDARFNLSTVKYQDCTVCGYRKLDNTQTVLPEIRFTFNKSDANADFATKARSTDATRPSVSGKISVTNAGNYNLTDITAEMKVRGNQTAGFDKKGFRIKFDKKQGMLGLNGGKKFKKWVLLADAKDTTVSRTALGLTLSKGVISDDSNVWASDFTPVSVYLNDTYWGMYMLAEQKEVKDGRIKLDEPLEEVKDPDTGETSVQNIMTNDIGYCFELDYYARNEKDKGSEGDPTFSIDYGNYFTRNSFNIESPLANSGLGVVNTYTMNSDINDGPGNAQTNDSNSNQVKYIKARLQALFTVLAEASKNKVAKDIDENNKVIAAASGTTLKQAIEKHFDLNAWAEGFIINAVCLPPDVGYSSFYMSFDNSVKGDKRLRYDNPWDFDSNFGNRRAFITTADSKEGNYDPYFMDRTANMWLQFLGKLDFFMNDYVKPKWKAVREAKVFENMTSLAETYYKYFEGEYQKNFTKWTTTQASDSNVSSYFNGDGERSGELRTPFVKVSDRKKAQTETINWLTKRFNYLDGKWGK